MKIIKQLLPILLISLILSGCSESEDNKDNNSTNETISTQNDELVVNPSVDYIVAGLSMVESVIGIELDPEGGQGDNVKATIYFASDLLELDDEDKKDAKIRTKEGGSIDIFSTVEDAKNRDEYLKKFDGKLVFDSGSHTVLGTIVIRTSSSLSEEKQNQLTDEIIEVLTSDVITQEVAENAMKKLNAGEYALKFEKPIEDFVGKEDLLAYFDDKTINNLFAISDIYNFTLKTSDFVMDGEFTPNAVLFFDVKGLENIDTKINDDYYKKVQEGGAIEIYSDSDTATSRNNFLIGYYIFGLTGGPHKAIENFVVQISKEFPTKDGEKLLENILEILKSEETRIEESKIEVGSDYTDLLGINYEDAQSKMKKAGFTNVELVKVEIESDEKVEGKTSKISIDGNSSFSKNDKFLPTAEVIIYYQHVNKIKAPDVWYNLVERHYTEIEKLFKDAGFTNVKLEPWEIDYNEVNTFEGSVVNICIGEDNVTFELDDEFYPSVEVRICYRVKPINPTPPVDEEEVEVNPYNQAKTYNVYTRCEYAHADTDVIRLGNKERAWITIEANPTSLTKDDFLFEYDNSMIEILNIKKTTQGNNVKIEYEIKTKKEGYSEIVIASYYDLYEDFDNAKGAILTVNGLNSKDGKVVYVTSTGEKYHYKSSCIDHATKTTLSDALMYEYEPCGKCVK